MWKNLTAYPRILQRLTHGCVLPGLCILLSAGITESKPQPAASVAIHCDKEAPEPGDVCTIVFQLDSKAQVDATLEITLPHHIALQQGTTRHDVTLLPGISMKIAMEVLIVSDQNLPIQADVVFLDERHETSHITRLFRLDRRPSPSSKNESRPHSTDRDVYFFVDENGETRRVKKQ